MGKRAKRTTLGQDFDGVARHEDEVRALLDELDELRERRRRSEQGEEPRFTYRTTLVCPPGARK